MWCLYHKGVFVKSFDSAEQAQKFWMGLSLAVAGEYTYRYVEVI